MLKQTFRRALLLVFVLALASPAGAEAPTLSAPASLTGHLAAAFGPAQRVAGSFKNLDPKYHRAGIWARFLSFTVGGTWLVPESKVAALPLGTPDLALLRDNRSVATVTWVGHSTLLVQLDGVTFLTDPTWAQRTGPFGGLVGVKRYTPPGIRLEDLPAIDFVLISHDHYDHLDEPTVKQLARRFDPLFIVPLGLKSWLADRGVTKSVELNWGESTMVKGVQVVCTPAQHGSGRTAIDQSRRLWSAWAVLGTKRFYFAGDTGYYRHFKDTGDALGPFDLAALPIGSYTPEAIARPVHISPEEALQAAIDLRAAHFVGIHWGTFALAREPFDEPPKRLAAEI